MNQSPAYISPTWLNRIRKDAGEFDHNPTCNDEEIPDYMIEMLENVDQYVVARHFLFQIEGCVMRTIDAAKNTSLDPIDENDIKAIILSHAIRMLGISVDAQRSNDLDDLILVNNLDRQFTD